MTSRAGLRSAYSLGVICAASLLLGATCFDTASGCYVTESNTVWRDRGFSTRVTSHCPLDVARYGEVQAYNAVVSAPYDAPQGFEYTDFYDNIGQGYVGWGVMSSFGGVGDLTRAEAQIVGAYPAGRGGPGFTGAPADTALTTVPVFGSALTAGGAVAVRYNYRVGTGIDGPTQADQGVLLTHTASISNYAPPVTYKWYMNGILANGSIGAQIQSYPGVGTITYRVLVQDVEGDTGSATFVTAVTSTQAGGGTGGGGSGGGSCGPQLASRRDVAVESTDTVQKVSLDTLRPMRQTQLPPCP